MERNGCMSIQLDRAFHMWTKLSMIPINYSIPNKIQQLEHIDNAKSLLPIWMPNITVQNGSQCESRKKILILFMCPDGKIQFGIEHSIGIIRRLITSHAECIIFSLTWFLTISWVDVWAFLALSIIIFNKKHCERKKNEQIRIILNALNTKACHRFFNYNRFS